jgi:hypothetical protein
MILFQTELPSTGLGSLVNRKEEKMLPAEKERELYVPQNSFYQAEATACAERRISVDMYICTTSFVDLATTCECLYITQYRVLNAVYRSALDDDGRSDILLSTV